MRPLIDLIANDADPARDTFVGQLSRLGYDVRLRSQGMQERLDPPIRTTILFLAGASFQTPAAHSAHSRNVPDLVVVPLDGGCWDQDLLHWCCDVVGWPCADRELRFRLARTSPPMPEPDRACGDEEDLLAQFSSSNLIGHSRTFVSVLRQMRQVIAARDVPVLIEGETGTGKELIARALHYRGHRSGGPFIPVNCGAIPDTLVEGELFGHERGAFTDAKTTHSGLIEQADKGTLFLDEVETLTPRGQVALLRFLQSQEYRPIGGRRLLKADVRILAATNQSLPVLIEQGRFREDLYFRLHVVRLLVPPLRRRREDVVPLAEHYAREFAARHGTEPKPLTPATRLRLLSHSWPGNIRELENFVHRLVVMGQATLGPGELAEPWMEPDRPAHRDLPSFSAAKARAIKEFEAEYLRSLLVASDGNVTLAARRAGKERRALGKLMKKHRIHRAHFANG